MTTSTWKYIGLGGFAVMIALFAANADVLSQTRGHTVTKQSLNFEQPIPFETNAIVGSDASLSTFGLDTGHVTDW